jgi:hypothetical protein
MSLRHGPHRGVCGLPRELLILVVTLPGVTAFQFIHSRPLSQRNAAARSQARGAYRASRPLALAGDPRQPGASVAGPQLRLRSVKSQQHFARQQLSQQASRHGGEGKASTGKKTSRRDFLNGSAMLLGGLLGSVFGKVTDSQGLEKEKRDLELVVAENEELLKVLFVCVSVSFEF